MPAVDAARKLRDRVIGETPTTPGAFQNLESVVHSKTSGPARLLVTKHPLKNAVFLIVGRTQELNVAKDVFCNIFINRHPLNLSGPAESFMRETAAHF